MKIRSIRPEFFSDAKMANLSHSARLLYIGLWCYVDDEGRGEYLPKKIEGDIFPHETVDLDELWAELEQLDRVRRYTVGDRNYFHIPSSGDHQKPNRKWESKLPPPPPDGGAPSPKPPEQDASTAHALRTHRANTAPAPLGDGDGRGDVDGVVDVERARSEPLPTSMFDRALRALAMDRARAKGARNPEGLARRILDEDHDDLVDELERRRRLATDEEARRNCGQCDSNGFIERDGAMWRCDHDATLQQAEAGT